MCLFFVIGLYNGSFVSLMCVLHVLRACMACLFVFWNHKRGEMVSSFMHCAELVALSFWSQL